MTGLSLFFTVISFCRIKDWTDLWLITSCSYFSTIEKIMLGSHCQVLKNKQVEICKKYFIGALDLI